jgi:hypothetical protein
MVVSGRGAMARCAHSGQALRMRGCSASRSDLEQLTPTGQGLWLKFPVATSWRLRRRGPSTVVIVRLSRTINSAQDDRAGRAKATTPP